MTRYSVHLPAKDGDGYGVLIITERLVENISESLSAVRELVELCNRLEVDSVQFDDVLEDYLSELRA